MFATRSGKGNKSKSTSGEEGLSQASAKLAHEVSSVAMEISNDPKESPNTLASSSKLVPLSERPSSRGGYMGGRVWVECCDDPIHRQSEIEASSSPSAGSSLCSSFSSSSSSGIVSVSNRRASNECIMPIDLDDRLFDFGVEDLKPALLLLPVLSRSLPLRMSRIRSKLGDPVACERIDEVVALSWANGWFLMSSMFEADADNRRGSFGSLWRAGADLCFRCKPASACTVVQSMHGLDADRTRWGLSSKKRTMLFFWMVALL